MSQVLRKKGLTLESQLFDEDYYERGIEAGVSCYQNYRWIPELTIPMAMTIIDHLEIPRHATILDFGCAKGYLVKALRLLYRDAWGIDISRYAIDNADPQVKQYCSQVLTKNFPEYFDFCIAKDVFEHIPPLTLEYELVALARKVKILFAIIPLGDKSGFIAPANNYDVTHAVCEDHHWWNMKFAECGWQLKLFSRGVQGIKDSYYAKFPEAHGFFVLRSA